MKPEVATAICKSLKETGINFIAYLPDTQIQNAQRSIAEDANFVSVAVSNQGEGVAICAGAWLGGKKPALFISDAGLLVGAWALASLPVAYGIPILLIVAYRGAVGDRELGGRGHWHFLTYNFTTKSILRTLQIPYVTAQNPEAIGEAITGAQLSASLWQHPVAILLSGEILRD